MAILFFTVIAFVLYLPFSPPAEAIMGGTATHMIQGQAMISWPLQILSVLIFFATAFGLGRMVQNNGWPVGYTRKILALTLYFSPIFAGYRWGNGMTVLTMSIAALVFMCCIVLLTEPFRKRSKFLSVAFAAIDRPEDRPWTLTWLLSSLVAMWVIMIAWIAFLPSHLLLVALFISGVGDALAEPVGLRFGRHKYEVKALFTSKRYIRTLEGSACVFISAIIGIFALNYYPISGFRFHLISEQDMILSLLLIPAFATFAEAKSPHTWDQPFIVLSCAVATAIIAGLKQPVWAPNHFLFF